MATSSRPTLLMPPAALVIAMIAMAGLNYWAPVVRFDDLWVSRVGILAMALSLLINVVGAVSLLLHRTTVIPFRESSHLVTTGLYRLSRNPIYVSMVVLLLGAVAALGSLSPLVVVPLFAAWIDRKHIRVEERLLEAKFGDSYREYRQRTRRWVWPFV